MKINTSESGFSPTIIAISLAVILIFGSVGIVRASDSAKPGDALYAVDTAVESFRLGLTSDPQAQVDLRTQYVAERLDEAQQVLQEQGAGAPGIDVALANLIDHRAKIATLVAQNQELQARVDALERQLESSKRGLENAFQLEGGKLENLLQDAKENGNADETSRLKKELDELEEQKETLEKAEAAEPKEAPEPEELEEALEANEDEESEESEGGDDNVTSPTVN